MESQSTQSALAQDTPIERDLARVKAVLNQIISTGGFELSVKVTPAASAPEDPEAPAWLVSFAGRDSELVLDSHAALLDALASVALKAARIDEAKSRRIAFDCQNYRQLRGAEIKLMARMAADRAIESRESYEMSPMNAAERRLVHLALRDEARVRTESQGIGPGRKVVIYPASLPKKA
ncbi:MAG: hypothetical protein KGM47_06650 [Acidobacteriota bacterium]|nr:hypothetical protein [Acidobacteriota bacterium]